MNEATRRLVRVRARYRCEYCGLPQGFVALVSFHVEHIVARQHGGSDDPDNLALACPWCNSTKGPNLSGIDLESNTVVPLFHPRHQQWTEHFAYQGAVIVGLTPIGRATVRVLQVNRPEILEMRLCASSEFTLIPPGRP